MMKLINTLLAFTDFYELFEWMFNFTAPRNEAQFWAVSVTAALAAFLMLGLVCFWFRRVYIDELERKVQAYNELEKQVIRKRKSSNTENGYGN